MRGWHAVTIVGYDDTLATNDGPGAFRLVNSWGTGFGDNGYFWMSYVAVMDEEMGGRQAQFSADRVDYEPILVGSVRLSHSSREKLGIQLGVGSWEQPRWFHDFRTFRRPAADLPFPDHTVHFDLTDGVSSLRGEPGDTIFVAVIDDSLDGLSGSIDYFEAEHLALGASGISPDPPVTIPDQGVYVWARAELPATGIDEWDSGCSVRTRLRTVLSGPDLENLDLQVFDSQGRDVTGRCSRPASGVYYLRSGRDSRLRRVVVAR
jgi:hypothetical protein